ncbi:MAG: outer membrane protein OmpA-like peptidoglycan-associated protein [Hyphomicrobiaceae bacterium]|jgi:outer membrane protein OmpA-like peptidoglycan-associated protein
MIAKATSRFVLPALVLGLALAVVGPPIAVAEGLKAGEFRIAQAGQPGQKLTKEERQKRRAARQQNRAAKKAAKPAAARKPNRERRAARPAPAAKPAARAARPAPPARAARPARPAAAARPARAARPAQVTRPARAARPAAAPQRRRAARVPQNRPAARPAPQRRSPVKKIERKIRKFFGKNRRRKQRAAEQRAAEARRAQQARRSAGRRLDRRDDRRRAIEGRPVVRRDLDRRRGLEGNRRLEMREARRDRNGFDGRRDVRRAPVSRDFRRDRARNRARNRTVNRRLARGRRHTIRNRQHRNRFRRGRSVYYLPPVGVALAASLYALNSSSASYDNYVDTFMAPPVRRLGRSYSMDEIVADPEVRAAVRSVNIDIVTFVSGSARISYNQIDKLEDLADAIHATLRRRPDEVFLIAGHTDAVGPFGENLDLSERRAGAVQELLITEFGVPARNLEAVGYGEQYLRVDTDEADRRNRRVVVRAVGSLLANRR